MKTGAGGAAELLLRALGTAPSAARGAVAGRAEAGSGPVRCGGMPEADPDDPSLDARADPGAAAASGRARAPRRPDAPAHARPIDFPASLAFAGAVPVAAAQRLGVPAATPELPATAPPASRRLDLPATARNPALDRGEARPAERAEDRLAGAPAEDPAAPSPAAAGSPEAPETRDGPPTSEPRSALPNPSDGGVLADPGLAGAVLRGAAHLSLDAGENGTLGLHLRLRDGVAELRVDGPAAPLVEARSAELRLALAREGVVLGSLELSPGTGDPSRHSSPRPEPEPEPPPGPRGPTARPARPARGEPPGHIHVEA